MSAKLNIELVKGTDFALKLIINDSAGTPIDLTGSIMTAQIREREAGIDFIDLDFSDTPYDNTGVVNMKLSKAQVNTIPYCDGVWSLVWTDSLSVADEVLVGDAKIQKGITT